MQIPQFTDFEMFCMFNIDMGEAYENLVRTGEGPLTLEQEKKVVRLSGVSLWHFRARQRSDKTVDWDALTPEELAQKRDRERRARAEQLAQLVTPQMAEAMQDDYYEGESLTDMLDPPTWINPPTHKE